MKACGRGFSEAVLLPISRLFYLIMKYYFTLKKMNKTIANFRQIC